jgi:myo-inositol-1-phosphate synthase
VVIDAVRCAKLALDRGLGGPVVGPSAYLMKTPPRQFTDDIARQMTDAFIKGEEQPATLEEIKEKVAVEKR